jgi:hypothetical protein
MLETSRLCAPATIALTALLLAACATAPEPPAAPESPRAVVPAGPSPEALAAAATEEAKALLAQAETDVQRARAKRALWLKAWEDLVVAREAVAAKDHPRAARHARSASELARLGLEQLTYPAVR